MDPLLMFGAWAGALVAIAAAARLVAAGFVRLVKAAIADEIRTVWAELRDQDDYFHAQMKEVRTELAGIRAELRPNGGASLRDTIDRLEMLVRERA